MRIILPVQLGLPLICCVLWEQFMLVLYAEFELENVQVKVVVSDIG